MRIDWHVPILMDDGIVLRADVFHKPGGWHTGSGLCATPRRGVSS